MYLVHARIYSWMGRTNTGSATIGQVVSAETARAIGERLLELIGDGSVGKYKEEFD